MSDLLLKVIFAFNELQEKHIRHHDISMKNIMITRDFDIKLIDFGLS
jgi:RIO-like serine/threonine protein kinase